MSKVVQMRWKRQGKEEFSYWLTMHLCVFLVLKTSAKVWKHTVLIAQSAHTEQLLEC